ncbi:MAG TPA: hydrogenase formation protein HypD [Methylococcus sp.]|nr:hydrogenase formation protein HypD [Methylococcus sp.]
MKRSWLELIRRFPANREIRIMNVCGGHERTITLAGLRSTLPSNLRLIPGPGCPVCVCPEKDIRLAIRLALRQGVILATFGDMLRVPIHERGEGLRSLEQAKAAGAEVHAIASPVEARKLAERSGGRPVVLFAVGFETTMAPVAALLAEGIPEHLFVLCSGRRTWPAVKMLLDLGQHTLDALIAPGHVATIMGPEEWAFVPDVYRLPAAVAGFTPASLLQAIHAVLCQWIEGRPGLENHYPQAVRPGGNSRARALLERCFDIVPAIWRGIGSIPDSGFALKAEFASIDARTLDESDEPSEERVDSMHPGCECAKVVLGRITPTDCRIYGRACTPRTPFGPCMVSEEGACRIWWAAGIRPEPIDRRSTTA